MDACLKLLLGAVLAITFLSGIYLIFEDVEGAVVMLGTTIFEALLFKLILPKRYQIYSDCLRIVLGGPFAWNIPFRTIKEAVPASGAKAFAYSGVRFATSSKGVVEIRRNRRMSVVISPSEREFFLEQLNKAMRITA